MKTGFMRKVDQWIGVPLCLLLTSFHRVLGFVLGGSRPDVTGPPRHVVVAKFFGMGSIVLCAHMIKGLKAAFPESRVTFVTFKANCPLVELLDGIDECRSVSTDSFLGFARDVVGLLIWMRKRPIDLFFDLEFFAKFSVILSYLSGARIRVGFMLREVWRRTLLTHPIYFNHYRHITEIFISMLCPLGIAGSVSHGSVFKTLPAQASVELPPAPFAVVNPNTSDLMDANMRQWPLENFTGLCRNILENSNLRLVLIGSGGDIDNCQQIARGVPTALRDRVINLAGKTTIPELCQVLRSGVFVLSNDSGPLHMAAALGSPVVALFGAETPSLYGPFGEGHVVFYRHLSCSPCVNVYNLKEMECFNSTRYECLRSIGVEEVLNGVIKRFPEYFSRPKQASPQAE